LGEIVKIACPCISFLDMEVRSHMIYLYSIKLIKLNPNLNLATMNIPIIDQKIPVLFDQK